MKTMNNQLLTLFLAFLMAAALVGCGDTSDDPTPNNPNSNDTSVVDDGTPTWDNWQPDPSNTGVAGERNVHQMANYLVYGSQGTGKTTTNNVVWVRRFYTTQHVYQSNGIFHIVLDSGDTTLTGSWSIPTPTALKRQDGTMAIDDKNSHGDSLYLRRPISTEFELYLAQ